MDQIRRWTPGPWFVGPTPGYLAGSQRADGQARRSDPITIRSPEHTEEIATVWTYLLPTEANANLIAAAPDMYEALRRLLIEMGEGGRKGRALDLLPRDTVTMAEAALQKAIKAVS